MAPLQFMSFLLFFLILAKIAKAQDLPELNIDVDAITVSGFSGGAYFATQFHVAFSDTIKGCAMWAGGPNLCLVRPMSA